MTATAPAAGRSPERSEGYDVHALRAAEFPWTLERDVTYLNNASTGPLPTRTIAAVREWAERRSQPWRIADADIFATTAKARELIARLIGAHASEIALMPNTTHGINVAARALPLKAGDVVVSFDREFPANVYPWMALADIGVSFEMLPLVDGLPDEPTLERAIERDDVRAIAVSWTQFSSGYTVDLARLGELCRARGKYFVVDAIQGVGARRLDLGAIHVDMLACGAQKWLLSPWGGGFLYVRRELVTQLEPKNVGWMAVRGSDDYTRLTNYDFTLRNDARRFEVVTLPYQDIAGMNASLELFHELGPDAIVAHIRTLTDHVVDWAQTRDDVRLLTPADPAKRAGIVALVPPDARGASARLKAAGVVHSLREGAIRLAPHGYNTVDEIDHALGLLAG